jgi:transcriptional regulator GlxA family with amidase domain
MDGGMMSRSIKRIGVLGFNGVNAVDVVGPIEVFASAGRADFTRRESKGLYQTYVIGLTDEPFTAESGLRFLPDCRLADAPALDTLIVPGGWGLRDPATSAAVSAWLRIRAPRTRRVASVCTGIYGLAPTGLLDGRRVTTHWRFAQDVAKRFPQLTVDANALFIRDGRYYTSGGITAGIDLALALVEDDLGPHVALTVARELVVYLKRSGGQEQYSEPLRFQVQSADRFSDLIAWVCAHLERDLSVAVLAERARLSPRHFSRRFAETFGCTPAQFVDNVRLSEARERLTAPGRTVDSVAASVGFGSADVFRRRFRRRFGVAPKNYRERFLTASSRESPRSKIPEASL